MPNSLSSVRYVCQAFFPLKCRSKQPTGKLRFCLTNCRMCRRFSPGNSKRATATKLFNYSVQPAARFLKKDWFRLGYPRSIHILRTPCNDGFFYPILSDTARRRRFARTPEKVASTRVDLSMKILAGHWGKVSSKKDAKPETNLAPFKLNKTKSAVEIKLNKLMNRLPEEGFAKSYDLRHFDFTVPPK